MSGKKNDAALSYIMLSNGQVFWVKEDYAWIHERVNSPYEEE